MTDKRFTITQDFEEHHRQIRDNGHIIMGCFLEAQAEPIVKLLNELYEENKQLKTTIKEVTELLEEEVDLFSDKATEHDINAYVELRELDNKDAYYMATSTKKAIRMLKELEE